MSDADAAAAIAAFQAFVKNLYDNKKSSYSYVSALSFLTWDIIVSFGDEVNYIWVSQWSIPKLIYFLARYYPFLYLIGANIMSLATDIPKRLSSLLVLVFNRRSLFRDHNIGHHLASSGLLVIQPKQMAADFHGDATGALYACSRLAIDLAAGVYSVPAPWQGCTAPVPKFGFVLSAYVPNLTLALVFLGLTLWKLFQTHRSLNGSITLKKLRELESVSPLLMAFVTDGSVFFALIAAALVVGMIPSFAVSGPIQSAFLPWTMAFYSYSGAHLILNLRSRVLGESATPTWNDTLEFVHPGSQRTQTTDLQLEGHPA
ncbi:hypothetical protein EV421DRAFT_1083293 [Armillaria borealis]|uniref:DUF6533 domain-containing protein n=1 Tax=Armillaria borealis TaxID=47425 RepID=A0AA39J6L4_9AGAR|nr:hypothetical protein EV421DRAFT_1083293 [Armillaria borealis]